MKILSIDTSSPVCSVSLLQDTELINELSLEDQKTHSENLMPLIDKLLTSSDLTLEQIDLIACAIGPGSFTGIRIGIATVKAMAEVLTIPVVGVNSLEGLAYNISEWQGLLCPLIDARNANAYYAGYFQGYEQVISPNADTIENIIQRLKKIKTHSFLFVGNGSIIYKEKLKIALGEKALFSNLYYNNQKSSSIGKCAFYQYSNGFHESADTLLPLYLRETQAERMKNRNG